MYFPKFWAKAQHKGASCWRWSDISVTAAHSTAETSARSLAASAFLEHLGNPAIHSEVKAIINLHDKHSKALSKLRLA